MSDEARLKIHQYFQEFGQEVGDAIYQEIRRPGGGLPRLLRRLGIPVEGDSTHHYKMLIQYFRQKGTDDFLQLVGARPVDFKIQVLSSPSRDDAARMRLGLNPIKDGRVLSDEETIRLTGRKVTRSSQSKVARASDTDLKLKQSTPVPPSPPQTPPPAPPPPAASPMPAPPTSPPPQAPPPPAKSPYDHVDEDGFPVGPLIPAPSPDPSSVQPNSPPYDPSKPFDPTGLWPTVERRSGRERRRKPDRRTKVDVVFKNKRYGGGRLTGDERRRKWPKKGMR